MFGYEDNRTPAERQRDLEFNEQRKVNTELSINFLREIKKRLDQEDVLTVGLVGKNTFSSGGEVLIESNGITYKLSAYVEIND